MKATPTRVLAFMMMLLATAVLAAGASARSHVKPCTGGCDDGDGPPVSSAPSGPVVNPGPPPSIDDSDQSADPNPPSPGDQSQTSPQVVTTPTTQSGDVTTVVPPPLPPPLCPNHPDFTSLPDHWFKATDGNCYYRGEDGYGMCHGDQYQLVSFSNVDHMLQTGYNMGIIVDTPDPNRRLNCIITDLVTYGLNPTGYVFSGLYVQDGWPQDSKTFDTPTPYPWSGWKPLYPFWVQKTQLKQYNIKQSLYSIRAYGLLWGTNRYQTVDSFARRLKAQGQKWRGWEKNHPLLATALISHVNLLRR